MEDDLKQHVSQFPNLPGVYQMYNSAEQLIYVGKARQLRQRVKSYLKKDLHDRKTAALMAHVVGIKITITTTENEALLLESNLIKQYRPRYNVLFRDDKSYPYLFLSVGQIFPRLDFHRGAKRKAGRYFGPFPSAGAVRDNLALIQKLFKIRQCSDSFFSHRTRPCLQYQIKRCTAPCVDYVSPEDYQQQVKHALLFLEGKSQTVINELVLKMQEASQQKEYEQAAIYRDQIASLRKLHAQQYVVGDKGHIDIIGVAAELGQVVISVLFVRAGRLLGHKTFSPKVPANTEPAQALSAFIPQYYLNEVHQQQALERLVLTEKINDKAWLQSALQQVMTRSIVITDQPRTQQFKQWCQLAKKNAEHALQSQLIASRSFVNQFSALQQGLKLPNPVQRIECFDVSHTSGEATVASCVVFNQEGPLKSDYRRFNIRDITPGDDYAALHQALTRRYTQVKSRGQALPDLLIIDGGKGQLNQAISVLEELQISGVTLLGVAKGPERKVGLEQLWLAGCKQAIQLAEDHLGFHLIQWVRDEAHRFAISGHRQRRAKTRKQSTLEEIPGVGAKRRRDLLNSFGGWQGLSRATVVEIAQTSGISATLAQRIYDYFH